MAMTTLPIDGLQERDQQDREEEGRNGLEEFGHPHQRRIEPATEISGNAADEHADERCEQRRRRAR